MFDRLRGLVAHHKVEFALASLIFGTLAYFNGGPGWNQNARLDSIFSFVEPGTDDYLSFRIDRFLPRPDKNYNTGDWAEHDGHYYANKAPGTALLGVPVYASLYHLEKAVGVAFDSLWMQNVNSYLINLIVSVLLTTAAAPLYYRMLRAGGLQVGLSASLVVGLFLGTGLFPYSTQLWGHTTTAALMILAVMAFQKRTVASAVAAGFFSGFAVCTEYQAAILVISLGLAYLIQRRSLLLPFIAGGALPLALFAGYHVMCFGTPFAFASSYSNPKFVEAANTFGLFGSVSPGVLWQLTFSRFRGIFVQMPILLLALPGFYFWFRRNRRDSVLWISVATVVGFLVMNASFSGWHGGATCLSRYQIPVLPILFLATKELPWNRTWHLCLTVLAVISIFNMTTVAAVTPGCPQKMENPVYGDLYKSFFAGELAQNRAAVRFQRLRNARSEWPEIAEWSTWNLGQLIGLRGLTSLVPLLLFGMLMGFGLRRSVVREVGGVREVGADLPVRGDPNDG